MEIDQIKELMAHLESSKLKKIHLKKGDFEIDLEKEDFSAAALPSHYHPPRQPANESPGEAIFHSEAFRGKGPRADAADGTFISSPLVGTFFASSAPDQQPFVKVGDRVEPDTVVCIVEAMKVMNEVKANISGVVSEILVENAHPVEFGTKIFRVIP